MLMTATGHTKKLAPVVGFGRAIGVHRAVNHHRRYAFLMGVGDTTDVILINRVGKALVMHHHVVALGPVGIAIKINLGLGSSAAFVDHLPLNLGLLSHTLYQRLALELIVVTATAGDQQCPHWFLLFLRLCRYQANHGHQS